MFHSCKQAEGQSVSDHVLLMKSYLDQLATLNYAFPDKVSISFILNSLSSEFQAFVQNYNMQSMEKIISKAKGKRKGKGLQNSYLTKPKKPQPYKKERPAKDGQCHHCKEEGHWKRNCPVYLAELIKKKKKTGGQNAFIRLLSRYGYVYLLKHKHEVFETFKVFKSEVENQLGKTIKAIRSDHGGEYISQEFKDYLKTYGIVQQLTPPYTPQHNGVFERRNRILLNMVRSMMSLTILPLSFWDYALESAARILNMVPTKKVDKTPYELWHGKVPNLSYLKVWGCEAHVKRHTPDKLQQRYVKCIFVGYPKETMGYYFHYPLENKIVVERYADFLEKDFILQKESGRIIKLEDEDILPSENTSEHPIKEESLAPIVSQEEDVIPVLEEHSLGDLNKSANYKAALSYPEFKKWLVAMNAEMKSMYDNNVWILVVLPPNAKVVKSKWIYKKKTDMDDKVHIYKARLVAKGCTQTYGVDYEETFSPVADIRAIRILIAIAAFYDYEIWQMGVKTAFLNGFLEEKI
ncbi:retrotransposon protein, putative, ty1-copia subclass [Tanacetum coccineum]